ncbi:diacylglycerol kinase eta [Anabrus simplex]|uniref:diacylglycerol kinase eta n=1 Tax=Anabrus simplex TaxID=316456 RepID=UPI0035A28853
MASSSGRTVGVTHRIGSEQTGEESSESDGETEPAKSFHRRLSTNRDIKGSASTKEGFLMKQTWSFNRWRRRFFQLKGHRLYYAKDSKSDIFDEIDLTNLSFAECSSKNVNHSFQVITPFRRLVLCAASRRDMEEWIAALKAASKRDYYEHQDYHGLMSGRHRWYATSHARPTYCNVCREVLSGVMSHGLSCEVCKFKVHKRCSSKAVNNCKWTTLSSVGKDIIEDVDGNIIMPHQWLEGNLPVSAKCAFCDRTCGSVLRLQDWRCLWCHASVHTACRPAFSVRCPLGPSRVSVVPPIALHNVGSDEAWEAVRPQGCSPLLVFVNSKSGDNQGVKFLRRFKQLLNPAQVFDLVSGGPGLGLRLFRHFDPFRILVCSGDGSVGWVLSEIDRYNMHKQCQVGVLPLGTGNDLARVLGWGSSCDDDTHLPQLLERYEKASTKMLDRWSVMTYVRVRTATCMELAATMAAYEDTVVSHLTNILQSDQHADVISSAKVLCETIKDFIVQVRDVSMGQGDDELSGKCDLLKQKLDSLLASLGEEESVSLQVPQRSATPAATAEGEEKGIAEKPEKELPAAPKPLGIQREVLMSRANSLKKAVRMLVEHTEQVVDEQNAQRERKPEPPRPKDTLKVLTPIESGSSVEGSPCPSPLSSARLTAISPLPDLRRDSAVDDVLPLPVPDEFADRLSLRRKSSVEIFLTTPSDEEDDDEGKAAKDKGNLLVQSDILKSPVPERKSSDMLLSVEVHPDPAADADVARRLSIECLEGICHIDSPENTEATDEDSGHETASRSPGAVAMLTSPEDELEDDDEEEEEEEEEEAAFSSLPGRLIKGCSLAHFEEGNDIARRSFYRQIRPSRKSMSAAAEEEKEKPPSMDFLDVVKIQIQGSSSNLQDQSPRPSLAPSEGDDEELVQYHQRDTMSPFRPIFNVVIDPPSPTHSDDGASELCFAEENTRKLSTASALLGCSPAATRRISSGSLFKPPESLTRDEPGKKLPIINPLVRLPTWPNVGSGAGLISKVLLANADALCAAVSPLMDPDETLLEGYFERCVMNNYFGIGIDAKISLDFHHKREHHPKKCRSRAKNYMWYGVLGSREWLQKTYKNLEQRVQLECDGQRIPLPSLQGIVVLNIPSFMGGTNFWGGSKEDDCFLAPSFDDRILEVVAVFGSVQMAASRLINLQHHRIAQCQTVQISILGDEGVPVQVDGEAWVQPPGVIRLIHKNRMQMLCRSRALETSLRAWEEKQRHHQQSVSPSSSTHSQHQQHQSFSHQENQLLLSFIESATTVVKYVKLVTISHPLVEPELYQLAAQTASHLEKVHPGGKIVEGPNLRPQVTDLVSSARQLYEEACNLLRDKAQHLRLREDLEGKLSAALASMEMELRRCVTYDSAGLVHFQQPPGSDDMGSERKGRTRRLFRLKFRRGGTGGSGRAARDLVSSWGVTEVAEWLEALQLGEYADSFTRNDIRGKELLTLGRRDLRELGVTKVGHVKRILQAVRDLNM